jgi:hypothetical protein
VPIVLLATACNADTKDAAPAAAQAADNAAGKTNQDNTKLTDEELAKKAKDSLFAVKDTHITAKGTDVEVDVKVNSSQQVEGHATVKGKSLELTVLDDTAYVRIAPGAVQLIADELKIQNSLVTSAAKVVEGKYVKLSDAKAKLADLPSMIQSFTTSDKPTPVVKRGEVTEVNGVKVIPLTTSAEGGESSTVFIAAQGDPFPVRVTSGKKTVDLTYTKLNEQFTPKAPPAADVVDLDGIVASFTNKS